MKFLKKHQKAVFLTLGVLFVILLWEIIAYATSQTFLKDFFLTCKESILLLGKSDTYLNLGFTLLRLLISFAISFAPYMLNAFLPLQNLFFNLLNI